MRFWDSSALVPLLVGEASSTVMRDVLREDPEMAVWWVTPVECFGAIVRRERTDDATPADVERAQQALGDLENGWVECPPGDGVRLLARRLIRVHDLRTADAFQLAAAETLSEGGVDGLPFVTLDDRLALAARREGFPVLP